MDGTTGQTDYAELAALVAQLQFELVALRAENQRLKQRITAMEMKNPAREDNGQRGHTILLTDGLGSVHCFPPSDQFAAVFERR